MEERRLIIVMLLVLILTFVFMTLSPTTPPKRDPFRKSRARVRQADS